MKAIRIVLGMLMVVAVACNKSSNAPSASSSASPTPTPTATPCALQGANTSSHQKASPGDTAAVTDVRHNSEGCPRIVFEFQGRVPGYKVEYASPPFSDCGSGQQADTSSWHANAYLEVRLSPSGGVDLSKSDKPTYTGPRDIAVDGAILKHLKVICDFEGVFTWVVALDTKRPFTAEALDSPPRLIVDVSETSTGD